MIIEKSRISYLAQLTILFLGMAFLLLSYTSTNDFINPDLQKGFALFISLIAALWLAAGQHGRQPAGRALLMWVVVSLVVMAFSLDSRRSASQVVLMSISVFVFALCADLAARGWPRELFVKALLMVGSVIILLGLLEAGLWYARWLRSAPGAWIPDVLYRPGNANVIAMFLNLLVMLAAARFLVSSSLFSRVVLAAMIVPALWLLFLTSSRGGWLGTAAGLVVLAVLSMVTGQFDWRALWRYLRNRPAALGGLLAGLLLVSGVVGMFLYQRTLHPSHGPVSSARSDYWPPAWEAFRSSPLVGTGQFTYSNAFIQHNSAPPWPLFIHSHGTPFNLLAEMGLLGALAMTLLVGTILYGMWKQLRAVQGADRGVLLGVTAAVAAVGVHSLFDCFHTETIGLWALCMVIGASLGQAGSQPQLGRRQNAWVLLVLVGLWGELWLTVPLHQGVQLANSGRWDAAAAAFDAAVRRDPASVIAYQQRALANSVLAEGGQPGTLALAAADLETVVQREPGWSINYANLGALYLSLDRPQDAAGVLAEALRRAPRCGLCALNLGVAREAAGDSPGAIQAYQQALQLGQPSQAYFWRSSPLREQAHASWTASHPAAVVSETDLRAAVEESPSLAGPYLALAAYSLQAGQLENAQQLLNIAELAYLEQAEMSLDREWLSVELLARQGRLETAAARGADILARYDLYGVYGPGSLGQLYYAPLMFRRPAMALELVPQLTRITLPDAWGQRAALAAEWSDVVGDRTLAEQLRAGLRRSIPDFSFGE